MSDKKRFPWGIFWGSLVGLFFVVIALGVINQADKSRSNLPFYGEVPVFEFTERRGETFNQADFLGKISIVDFIFTRCQGACPIMARAMRPLYQLYEGYDAIQFVSISVDPEYDTPEVLSEYAIRQGVTDNRWVFLNGQLQEVVRVSEEGFLLPADQLPMGHSTRFVLVDQKGQIRGYYDSYSQASMDVLKIHIRALYKAGS
jgi:protein SCO1/2